MRSSLRMAVNVIRKSGYGASVGALLAFAAGSHAAPLALPDSPLFLSAGVQPNLIMAIDDSGSMDNETLFPGNDGAAWWRIGSPGSCPSTTGSFVGCVANSDGTDDVPVAGKLNFNNTGEPNGNWRKFTYLFPNGCGSGDQTARRRACDGTENRDNPVAFSHFAIPPLQTFAWSRSSTHNAAYFNPATSYDPWPNRGDYTFTNSPPTAARFDPVFEATVTIDLTRDIAGTGNANTTDCNNALPGVDEGYYFRVYTGMTLPEGTCIRRSDRSWESVRSGDCTVGTNNGCRTREGNRDNTYTMATNSKVAIRYFPATFYLPQGAALPTTYGYIASPITGGKAPNGDALDGYEIKSGNFATTTQYNTAIQNFANWFTYYRKRHQALRAGLGQSFSTLSGIRVAGFTINSPDDSVDMLDVGDPDNRDALYQNFYYDWVRSGGTPNRNAVSKIIANFRRTDATAPVQASCQKNFGMLFTDGFSNAPDANDGITAFGGVDNNQGAPYADSQNGTLADGVMSAYLNPLRTGTNFPAGRVSVPTACRNSPVDPSLDCNRNLHMNFFAVTLGTRGLQFNPDSVPAQDPYTAQPVWPTNFPTRHPSAVDDIWHATVNGRGKLLNAKSPRDISTQLSTILQNIIERNASAASASVNGGTISSDTRIYQAKFDSASWTGQLLAYSLDTTDGDLLNQVWDASERLPAPADRRIFTVSSAGTAMPFDAVSIAADPVRQAQLNADPTIAAAMVQYLRGDATNETNATGSLLFRPRNDSNSPNKLGDIVSSSPLFVGAPPYRYRDSLETSPYSAFATSNARRQRAVYAGANDGMLHAFNADTGSELFAFIPSTVFPRLRDLTSRNYTHQFYVDGAPAMGDVFYGGSWHTVLVGGLNKGGQGIYALDVTNPAAFSADSVLWEYTDADEQGQDLGLTFSQPAIVKLQTGRWAAVFGNGYNSTTTSATDTIASTTGNAVLYIVDIETGSLIKKIDTGIGTAQGALLNITYDNGLSTPSVVDVDGDRVVEFAYAGDLYGNLWKFDLSSTDSGDWDVAFGNADAKQPLFVAQDTASNRQPITVRPEVARGPFGNGVIVLFGTGKYLEAIDRLINPVRIQSFYGIVDTGTSVDGRGSLTQQTIDVEMNYRVPDPNPNDSVTPPPLDIRVTSNNTLGANSGWYLDLTSPATPPSTQRNYKGEKQVSNPVVRNGNVIFTTLIPDADPCGSGGTSWIMELDLLDGSRLETTPFDVNGDGMFSDADKIPVTLPDGTTVFVAASGVGSTEGILVSPGILEGERGAPGQGTAVQYKYLPGTSGAIQKVTENPGVNGTGRQSWRQIR